MFSRRREETGIDKKFARTSKCPCVVSNPTDMRGPGRYRCGPEAALYTARAKAQYARTELWGYVSNFADEAAKSGKSCKSIVFHQYSVKMHNRTATLDCTCADQSGRWNGIPYGKQ